MFFLLIPLIYPSYYRTETIGQVFFLAFWFHTPVSSSRVRADFFLFGWLGQRTQILPRAGFRHPKWPKYHGTNGFPGGGEIFWRITRFCLEQHSSQPTSWERGFFCPVMRCDHLCTIFHPCSKSVQAKDWIALHHPGHRISLGKVGRMQFKICMAYYHNT